MLKLLGLAVLYLAVSTAILHAVADQAATKAAPARIELSPDSVPNKISCQFRGQGFCQPTRFNV